jgi:hypothetical protein
MDRAKLRSILLAVTFRNGVRVSTGKRWGGIALSVVVFFGVGVSASGFGVPGALFGTVAVYAFWVLWRHAFGHPDEFWGGLETATPQPAEVPKGPAVEVAQQPPAVEATQQPVTIIVEKKSSAAVWVLVIIVLVVIGVVALGGCSVLLVPA